MVDAVGTGFSSGPSARIDRTPAAEESKTQQQQAAAPAQEAPAAATPAYISPVVRVDSSTQTAVLQFRDSTSGDVTRQYPSEQQLRAYNQGQDSGAERAAAASSGAPADTAEAVTEQLTRAPSESGEPSQSQRTAEVQVQVAEAVAQQQSTQGFAGVSVVL